MADAVEEPGGRGDYLFGALVSPREPRAENV
jgi:hypothetical protein